MSDILTKRAAILEKYASLRAKHPALPEVLRDFQVYFMMTLLGKHPQNCLQVQMGIAQMGRGVSTLARMVWGTYNHQHSDLTKLLNSV